MTEYISQIVNDQVFQLVIIMFSGLYFSVFLIGYFISLIISLLYKIIRHN